jgi:hypothetical protein
MSSISYGARIDRLLRRRDDELKASGWHYRVSKRILDVIIFRAKKKALKRARRNGGALTKNSEEIQKAIDDAIDYAADDIALQLAGLGVPISFFASRLDKAVKRNDLAFIARLCRACGRGHRRPFHQFDKIDMAILDYWDGMELAQAPGVPGLKLWSGPAAAAFIASLIGEPGFSYEAYKKRCLRSLGLHPPPEKKKIVIRSATYVRKTVGRSLAGREVFDHILEAVPLLESFLSTRKSEGHTGALNMSRDKVTRALFNAASENGKNRLKRSSRKKHRVNRRAAV